MGQRRFAGDWTNLNGLWDYAIQPAAAAAPQAYQGKLLVPFPVESALSGVRQRVDDQQRLWYHRTFQIPQGWQGRRVLLHFQAVDWEATVAVNGKELGSHRGGYDAFTFDITEALQPSGDQQLVVKIFDPTDKGNQPRGKQVLNPGGIFYTPSTGIWQTVWLEPVPEARIGRLVLVPDVDTASLRIKVEGVGTGAADTVEVVARDGQVNVGQVTGKLGGELRLEVPKDKLKLWTPNTPQLYDLTITLKQGGTVVDRVDSYFAMRKIALGKDDQGILRLMLNGQFVFQVGPLDQGFWPDGLYTAPTDEALRYDIEATKKLGMNLARKHVKIEPDRWYYWCDKLGLLVWQDMAAGDNRTPESKQQFELELQRMIEGLGNHPSIIMWVVFNEGWGQHDTQRYVETVKRWDPSRLVNNASGWTDQKCGDVIDMHNYPGPGSPQPEATRAAVLGEFGGLGLAVPQHTWSEKSWGYAGMADLGELTRRYCKLLGRAWQLKDSPGLCAVVYTQTTDVETECNGLLTYDRAIIKVDAVEGAAANRGEGLQYSLQIVVPTSQQQAATWRYTFDKPDDTWFQSAFDDAAWKSGPGGFGTRGTPGSVVGTEWKTNDIWLRRSFELPDVKTDGLEFVVHHDEDVEIYINGVLAGKAGGFTTDYDELALTAAGRAALKPGKNVLAVHCKQTQGGQYIDVGLVELKQKPGK
ncbi:MAG: glycoside hydrolase family 2 [Planctomycetota bacterium]|nr:glycoside hydrolase family 2 [Planctomycetota bacterium]